MTAIGLRPLSKNAKRLKSELDNWPENRAKHLPRVPTRRETSIAGISTTSSSCRLISSTVKSQICLARLCESPKTRLMESAISCLRNRNLRRADHELTNVEPKARARQCKWSVPGESAKCDHQDFRSAGFRPGSRTPIGNRPRPGRLRDTFAFGDCAAPGFR
jgi:hypothetical protein